ncbi:division/cell wall cluster transcriptional repressor MraZ [Deinococcus radiophilus]|uniref:Transcriptional regulator MraZ n=1 Tax=Deinococcus radiophilus TaxID=32062 RepID=A0A431VZF5_9DEIO|nr:division/cell wall cluster transcriptional repressor MraZ [Deinococcus radiophilus]RTR28677.1 transcriptional regulator MraZ [Deinococcus radiophilus]UFA51100.1 division/cell wall cluster transcriptional repressor MraZ [Deinococcus radiophilus]
MPFGEYPYNLDDKGRLVMPPSFREFVEDGLILTRGMEGCLYLFPLSAWRRIEEQLEGLPITDAPARSFVRFFYSGASKGRLDGQSRISVPGPLRQFAALDTQAVVVGAPGRLELWNPERWAEAIDQTFTESAPPNELLRSLVV